MYLTITCALFTSVLLYVNSTHIFTLDKDFNKLKTDEALAKHVGEIVKKLKTFKVAVHPRIRLFYQLLKRGMSDFAQRNSDSLYNPRVYQIEDNKA
ncbi:unnamed protein product [Pieris macdunnoughi]|uniref:Uncharacterized protein n=1 Tax=Pieris macdunnoughi TaxID=345717 RepID=A0A821Y716_9NEOP|nr:unnamed protein product [Pieris macdunnoughi]